jgi:hypothetical protein
VRERRLLRFLKKQARNKALSRDEASTDPFDRAARSLVWCYVDEISPGEIQRGEFVAA